MVQTDTTVTVSRTVELSPSDASSTISASPAVIVLDSAVSVIAKPQAQSSLHFKHRKRSLPHSASGGSDSGSAASTAKRPKASASAPVSPSTPSSYPIRSRMRRSSSSSSGSPASSSSAPPSPPSPVTAADGISDSLAEWTQQLQSFPQCQYSNFPLQLHRDPSSPSRGYGVLTVSSIPRHSLILEYAGSLVSALSAAALERRYAALSPSPGCYMFYFESGGRRWCVDATMVGEADGCLRLGYGRFVNHGRKGANVYGRVLNVDGRPRLCFFSKRQLRAGEELLIDYGDRSRENRDAFPWLRE